MTNDTAGPSGTAGGFHTVHPERDLESNWEVDLAKKLEDYLLKICSGEITGEDDGCISVNFAEAALLLQGSVQVYSRKVEYLYTLVIRALEFLSHKRQQDHLDESSNRPEASNYHGFDDEENDQFWVLDDIPVEQKNSLDSTSSTEVTSSSFIKPPANLVVLEGECFETTGDYGELESYLLASSDLYRDFILLDTCDTVAVNEYLRSNMVAKEKNSAYVDSSARKSFQSPTRHCGGTAHKSSAGRSQCENFNCSPQVHRHFGVNDVQASSHEVKFKDNNFGFEMDDRGPGYSDWEDSDDDDPWKPLNPHEPGNLRVKPFKKVKSSKKNWNNSTRQISITALFPLAKLHGPISPELMEVWEIRRHAYERKRSSKSPPLYEQLRESLVNRECETSYQSSCPDYHNNEDQHDNENSDFDVPENTCMDEDVPFHSEKHNDDGAHFDNEGLGHDGPNSQASLEDLCRSHLDSLLATIAETEKQTEIAARVSTWKQRIEHNLEEQESHPPFDIHDYGAKILDKVSCEASDDNVLSFSDIVKGQEKYDVARSFSALLQLVNNGDVDLERCGISSGDSICYTAANPFHVRILNHDKKQKPAELRVSKKRPKSLAGKLSLEYDKSKSTRKKCPATSSHSMELRSAELPSQQNCKFSSKLGKVGITRCSPKGKRRRKSQYVEPVDLHSSAG